MILDNKIVNTFSVIPHNFSPRTRESMNDLDNEKFFVFNQIKFGFEFIPFFNLLIVLKELTYKVNSFNR